MNPLRFEHVSELPTSAAALWQFHLRSDALRLLSPPGTGFRVIDSGDGVANGSVVVAEVGPWPLRRRWVALHAAVIEGVSFTDVALESPFRYWVHQHSFEPVAANRSRLRDVVWYLPPAWLPRALARPFVGALLGIMFAWRHRRTREVLSGRSPRRRSSRTTVLAKGA